LAFASGIAAAPWVPPLVTWPLLMAALAWGMSLVHLGRLNAAAVCLVLGGIAAGALRATPLPLAADHAARLSLPAAYRIEGRLLAEPTPLGPERTRLLLAVTRVDGEPRSGRVRLTAWGRTLPPLTSGQRVAVGARLHPVTGYRNPSGFDYAAHLRRDGILISATVRADRVVALNEPRPPWPVRVRRAAREAMRASLPPPSAALLAGLVLGDRAELPGDIDEAFRRAGVYHVLAVSGFNVALVAGSAWALLVLARAGRRGAAVGAMVAVMGFAFVVGPEPSVLRAVLMAVLVLAALLLDRETAGLNSLALAAIGILTVRPGDLADPGFQLSFAATAGIVLAPLPRGLVPGALGVSVAAQLAVLPIALAHFNQLSLIGPLANLVAVPLAGLATVLGLAGAAVGLLTESAGAILLSATWPVLLALRGAVALAAVVPGGVLHAPAPHWSAVAAYGLGLGLALGAWRCREASPERARRLAIGAGLLLALAVGIAAGPLVRLADGRMRITVLDVGQGDAIVVEGPDGSALLVDAGPGGPMRLDTGERVVAPFLWNRGILRLAGAVTTHDDADHAGGMPAVRRRFDVMGTLGPGSALWLGPARVLVFSQRRQGEGSSEPVGFRSSAAPPLAGAVKRQNADALILRVDHGLASFLLAADLTSAGEHALLEAEAPLGAAVLKVGHHGSRHSSTAEFLARVSPRLAVISVGPRNPFGHPAPETLGRLAAVGARVYRTDRDGAVIFETDGRRLTVTRWATGAVDRYCLDPDAPCGPDASW
jgi:competence protein ComEC